MDDETEHVCSTTLMVLGDGLIPQRVTGLLRLDPTRTWIKGERKSFICPDGTTHYFDSVHEWGGWKCFIPDGMRSLGLVEQLTWWCDELEGREPALRELEAQGLLLRMDCFIGARGFASVELGADLQGRLSRLRLSLTVCFSHEAHPPGGEAEQADASDRE